MKSNFWDSKQPRSQILAARNLWMDGSYFMKTSNEIELSSEEEKEANLADAEEAKEAVIQDW